MRLEMRSEFLHPVLNGEYRPAEKHEVAGHCRGDSIAGDCIHRSALQRKLRLGGVAVPTDHLTGKLGCSQGQPSGSAYEAGADDSYALDRHLTGR